MGDIINKEGVAEDAIGVLQAPPDTRPLHQREEGEYEPGWDIYRHARLADLKARPIRAISRPIRPISRPIRLMYA